MLDALGDSNAQFFITVSTSFTFDNIPSITLINGASNCNIFWLANTGAITFTGTMPPSIPGIFIAGTAITFDNGSQVLGRVYAQSAVTFSGTSSSVNAICTQNVVCYAKGTLILTNKGFVPIEHIHTGHKVVTKGKIYKNSFSKPNARLDLEPVVWVSKFKVTRLNTKSRPICITKNALGQNCPFQDLYVSPGHSILVNGQMVLAKHMVNGNTIYQDEECEAVEYYHVECENHSVLMANGVLSESYLAANNRDVFENSVRIRTGFNLKKIYDLR